MTTATENSTTTSEALATLAVVTVAPAKLADNEHLISWTGRSTEKNPLDATNRFRGIVVHSATLAIPDGATTSKFSKLLQETIHKLADAKFSADIKDQMTASTVQAAAYSLDAVLAYWAEEKQRQVIDGAKIIDWLKQSATYQALDAAKQKVWLSIVPKMAAPSYSNIFTTAQAAAIVAKIADADTDHPIALFIATRCNNIINKLTQEAEL